MQDEVNIGVNFIFGGGEKRPIHSTHTMTNTGYCVWQWTQGHWVLKRNRCAKNCVPQEPGSPGRFESQYRAVIGIPREYRAQ